MRAPGIVIALFTLVAGASLACGKTSMRPHWRTDVDGAAAEAHAQTRPMLVFVEAAWNTACAELDRKTFTDPSVLRALQDGDVITVRADVTDEDTPEEKALRERYAPVGVPTLIFYDGYGNETSRILSFVGPAELTAAIDDAAEKARWQKEHPLRW